MKKRLETHMIFTFDISYFSYETMFIPLLTATQPHKHIAIDDLLFI